MRNVTAAAGLVLCLATGAFADDADLSFGGAPRMMSGGTSVVMQSEVVRMTVGQNTVDVDCRFVFKNSGPACTIRMGFPDRGRGGSDPMEREGESGTSQVAQTFKSFASYVDGRPVDTKVVQDASNKSDLWHIKQVHFGAGQTVRVRDVYRTVVGAQVSGLQNFRGETLSTYYVLNTGASWAGKIGRAEVDVTFKRPQLRNIHLVSYDSIGSPNPYNINWPKLRANDVVWRGPSRPSLDGNTLRFVRTDFKPAYKDDVLLFFVR